GHVQARLQQVAELQQRAAVALQMARDVAGCALAEARDHLWLPPSVLARVQAVHDANMALASALHEEADRLTRGFAGLPVDVQLENTQPEPVAIDP
ncbi:MAG: hypothetical protein ABJA49_05800, partial [Betaproteobacteria bacterium]